MRKYKLILADPPWAYRNTYTNCSDWGQVSRHYGVLQTSEISEMPVNKVADTDSVLLLWVTWPLLLDGVTVLNSWGFEYVTGFPWVKATDVSNDLWGKLTFRVRLRIGYWVRGCSEVIMIGKRGAASPPNLPFVGLLSPNVSHSRKPDSIYEYAESLPGPYLELFARRLRPGWDSWGNEIEATESFLSQAFNQPFHKDGKKPPPVN